MTNNPKITNPFGPITDRRQTPLSRFQSVLFHPVTLWMGVFLANALALSILLFHWTFPESHRHWVYTTFYSTLVMGIPWGSLYHWHPLILSAVLCLNVWAWPRLRS